VGMDQGRQAGRSMKEAYVYYKTMFEEMSGADFSAEKIATMAMEHALKTLEGGANAPAPLPPPPR
jgi:hypothetical protein